MTDPSARAVEAARTEPRMPAPGVPQVVALHLPGERVSSEVRAFLIGSRIDTRHLQDFVEAERLVPESGGAAFVFRYGVVVLFGLSDSQQAEMMRRLSDQVVEPLHDPEVESIQLEFRPSMEEQVDADGHVVLHAPGTERLLLTATVLARSVVLARDELWIAEAFDRIEPLVNDMRTRGRASLPIRRVMQHVGDVLAARHRVVGRVQVGEKPDLLWEHPELERLYARLEAEFELDERARVIERKLDAIGDAVEVLLDIVQGKRSARLELAIIALIMFEIVLTLLEKAGL